jgi:hypothetical protein
MVAFSIAALQRFLRLTKKSGEATAKSDPALSQSVTFENIVRGVKIAEALPWSDMLAALESHFSDQGKTLSTIEEILEILAPFIPGVIPFEEAARVLVVLCKLDVIKVQHGATPPLFGSSAPENPPFI